jgi:hypothetical protein
VGVPAASTLKIDTSGLARAETADEPNKLGEVV